MKKFRWSKVYESSEEELQHFLTVRSISAERVDLETAETVAVPSGVTVWCAEGSCIASGQHSNVSLQPGDGLIIDADIDVLAGISGCVYYIA